MPRFGVWWAEEALEEHKTISLWISSNNRRTTSEIIVQIVHDSKQHRNSGLIWGLVWVQDPKRCLEHIGFAPLPLTFRKSVLRISHCSVLLFGVHCRFANLHFFGVTLCKSAIGHCRFANCICFRLNCVFPMLLDWPSRTVRWQRIAKHLIKKNGHQSRDLTKNGHSATKVKFCVSYAVWLA